MFCKFIILISGKARVGKDTFAIRLKNACQERKLEFKKVSLADPIKELAHKYFAWDGKKDKRGRKLLIDLGTVVGRNYNVDTWVKYIMLYLVNPFTIDREKCVVFIPDNRFPDEIENVIKFKYGDVKLVTVRIDGEPRLTEVDFVDKEDITEVSLDNYGNFDYIINNNGTIDEFQIKANELIDFLFTEKDE